jgi:hypothetical protein
MVKIESSGWRAGKEEKFMDVHDCLDVDRVLTASVVASWPELIPNAESGLIHVEYDFAATGGLNFSAGLVVNHPRILAPDLYLPDISSWFSKQQTAL